PEGSGDGTSAPAPSKPPVPAGPGAEELVEELRSGPGGEDLGEVRDNSSTCSNQAAGGDSHERDCRRLLVTDEVSVYEFPADDVAVEWVNRYGEFHGEEWRRVDRFALVWNTPEQETVPAERRDEITELVENRLGEG
ncbi:hypothetical protein, partial [Streptomyces alkaliphilus]|uniref:hypothetical protein n=1 Tax=Streptomyces alkaliphilus TaxID=1472722 RepID=UPI001564CF18